MFVDPFLVQGLRQVAVLLFRFQNSPLSFLTVTTAIAVIVFSLCNTVKKLHHHPVSKVMLLLPILTTAFIENQLFFKLEPI